jgi:hypothetical protein
VRAELSPSSSDKARLRAALGLSSGTLASAAAGAPLASVGAARPALQATPALTRRAALLASGKLGISLGALLFAAGVGMGLLWRGTGGDAVELAVSSPSRGSAAVPAASEPAAAAPAATSPREPAAESSEAEPVAARPAGAPRAAAHRARAQAAPAAPLPEAADPLTQELALLRRVERALRASDPALAVALLAELDRRFPHTRLGEEREAARTMADCRRHEPGAVLPARAFLQAHPASVYSERVRSACGLETHTNDSAR